MADDPKRLEVLRKWQLLGSFGTLGRKKTRFEELADEISKRPLSPMDESIKRGAEQEAERQKRYKSALEPPSGGVFINTSSPHTDPPSGDPIANARRAMLAAELRSQGARDDQDTEGNRNRAMADKIDPQPESKKGILEVRADGTFIDGEPVSGPTRVADSEALHADDKAIFLSLGIATFGSGLIGYFEGYPWLGTFMVVVGLVVTAPASHFVRTYIRWLSGRAALWSIAIANLLFLTANLGWLVLHPAMPGVHQVAASPQATVGFVPTKLRLQFFGDDRLPIEISRDNVDSWFAYRSPTMAMTPMDKHGKPVEGGFQVPASWAIFIVLEKPAIYRQVVPTFSNPDVMPFTEIRQTTQSSIVATARSQFPAGVLEITAAQ